MLTLPNSIAYTSVVLITQLFSVQAILVKEGRLFSHCFYPSFFSEFNISILQFTRAGHTQVKENAIMITSTITVVLFSTTVHIHFPYMLYKLSCPNTPRQHTFPEYDLYLFCFCLGIWFDVTTSYKVAVTPR